MRRIFQAAQENPLFQGIAFSDFEAMLTCMSAKTVTYQKGEAILWSGETLSFVGLVLSGNVRIIREDIEGRTTLLSELGVSNLFGEIFVCAGITQSPVTVLATENTEVLLIDYRRIITSCTAACPFHTRLIENMLKLIAQKSMVLNQKNEILSKRSTREKLLMFFDIQRGMARKFTIPFNREQLADYLCVNRSAMSNELCKMRDEGLIKFQRNTFEVL